MKLMKVTNLQNEFVSSVERNTGRMVTGKSIVALNVNMNMTEKNS